MNLKIKAIGLRQRTEMGKRIKAARRRCKMSQQALAKLFGHPRITLARVELGQSEFSVLELEHLAFLLHVPLAYFLTDKELDSENPYQRRTLELAQRIRRVRKEHGLTQVKIAQIVGCSTTRWSQIENGHTELNPTEITILADALKIPIEALLPQ